MDLKIIAILLSIISTSLAHHNHRQEAEVKSGKYNTHRYVPNTHAKHGSRSRNHGSHSRNNSTVSDKVIQEKINAILDPKNNTEILLFLSAMVTPEGQRVLKPLGVNPTEIEQLRSKVATGTADDIAKVKAQIKQFVQTYVNVKNRKIHSSVRAVFEVYQMYTARVMAKQQLQLVSVEDLRTVLTALTAEEVKFGFRGINFSDLLQTLNSRGDQGKKEVVDKLGKWILTVPADDLNRAYKVVLSALKKTDGITVTPPPTGSLTTARSTGGNSTTTQPGNATTIHPNNVTTAQPPNVTPTLPGNVTTTHPASNLTTTHHDDMTTTAVIQTTSHAPAPSNYTTTPPRPEPVKRKKINP